MQLTDAGQALLVRARSALALAHRGETIHAAYRLIMAGEGVAILPACAADASPPGLEFRPLADAEDRFDVAVCWRSDLQNPLIEDFLGAVRAALLGTPRIKATL